MVKISPFHKKIEKLKAYYETEFSINYSLSILGQRDFHCREFGFQVVRDDTVKFIRNISFKTPEAFLEYVLKEIPLAIYVGAIYSEGPDYRQQKSINQIQWVKRELIFDLDLTEYDSVRPCNCKGKIEICERCWELINVSMVWIHETLKEDFGVKNIQWVFSGRRGVHAWVLDHDFSTLDSDQRAAIVEYLTFFKGDGDSAKFSPVAKNNHIYLDRVGKLLYETYFRDVTIDQLLEIGFTSQRAIYILNQRDRLGIDRVFLNKYIFTTEKISKLTPTQPSKEKILHNVLLKWSPRIDRAVTIDLRRILRLPGSIHGDVGRVVRLIDEEELEYFNPFSEESIY
ncbi:MAG: DNA primase catalytic subunit PriS [Candidatus Hodarchaeales archaeon]|jgi:DNA primase small subunit